MNLLNYVFYIENLTTGKVSYMMYHCRKCVFISLYVWILQKLHGKYIQEISSF